MLIDGGRLVPETAWDAERLASYRNKSKVSVVITQEVASWARRRYWAILGVVVKTCKVPARVRTPQDLHDAIRKQIGFVDSHSSDGKTLTVKLKSTSKLDDQQFEAYAAEAYAELSEMTGVDVMTLGKEAPDVGEDDHQSQDASPPPEVSGDGSGDAQLPLSESAPDNSAETADQEDDAGVNEDGADASSSARDPKVILNLKAEAVDKFLQVATSAELDLKQRRDVLEKTKEAWKQELRDHPDFVKACLTTADKVIKNQMPIAEAREYLSRLVR